MRHGMLIALSGVDCAGKTTQRELLFGRLWGLHMRPVTVWSRPGYTPGLETLKRLLGKRRRRSEVASPEASTTPETPAPRSRYPRRAADLGGPLRRRVWLDLALLDLLWQYGVRLRWLRALGRAVICDRYLLDCLVDFRVNFPDDRVERNLLWRLLWRVSVRPDAALCLIVPPEETDARAARKSRSHREALEVLEARWRTYRSLSRELDVAVLDGLLPADELARRMWRSVAAALPGSRLHPDSPGAASRPHDAPAGLGRLGR